MTNAVPFDWQTLIGAFEGGRLSVSGVITGALCLVGAYVVFSLAQRFWVRHSLLRSVGVQVNLLVLALLTLVCLGPLLAQMHPHVINGVRVAAVFFGVAVGLKVLDVLVFDMMARWRNRPPAPIVVRDIGRLVLSLLALVMIVRGFFPGVNLNVLAVSSLVVGYIVGNATQDTLGNLFAGLALNAERPFHIGDWVLVAGHTGIVVDTTWRATRLKTKAEDYIVLPNAAVAKEPIINYSRPTRVHGCYLSVGVSYETPPGKARETILAVLAEIPDVARDPAPSVYLTSYGDFSINFTIKCFIQDFERLNPIESQVMERLWYGFRRAGISIPFPIRDVRMRDAGEMDRAAGAAEREHIRGLLSGVDLFQTLSAAEFGQLVQGTRAVMFGRGEVLCRQGDTGAAFYVIQSGRVAVSVAGADGVPVTVAQLGPSAFFGEMALLTGEPRSATITADGDVTVLEVSKDLFAGFLRADAALAEKLGVVLEKRVADRQAKVATGAGAAVVPARVALVARIRKFFGLG
jgi:small-conductance mechanosensitive channel/CRP-like cAMP-binding protein